MTPTRNQPLDGGAEPLAGSDAIAWLVINLDRAPGRWQAIRHDAERLGLRVSRIAAVDGRDLPASLPGIDGALYRRTHGRTLRADEVGCFLSHLRALRAFLALPQLHAMILEDDAILTAGAVGLVRDLTAGGAPDDWDLVKFEAHHDRHGLTVRRLSASHRLCVLPFKAAGSAAYLINRDAAERLLDDMLPMRYPYDIAFDRAWESGLRVRAILPLPIGTGNAPSTIHRDAGTPDRRRLGARARLETKLLRLAAAGRAWCFPGRRFGGRRWDAAPGRVLADAVEAELALSADRPPASAAGSRSSAPPHVAPTDDASLP